MSESTRKGSTHTSKGASRPKAQPQKPSASAPRKVAASKHIAAPSPARGARLSAHMNPLAFPAGVTLPDEGPLMLVSGAIQNVRIMDAASLIDSIPIVSNYPVEPRLMNYQTIYEMAEADKVSLLRRGIEPAEVVQIAEDMGVKQLRVKEMLRLAQGTFSRRARKAETLNLDESERVLRLKNLIGLAQKLAMQFGNATDFDAAKWIGQWVETPIPALGNVKPADYMDTGEGAKLVESTLIKTVTGVAA